MSFHCPKVMLVHFFIFLVTILPTKITGITTYYSRYPVPFGWLQKLVGSSNNRIIHYVGDPVEVILKTQISQQLKIFFNQCL